LARQGGIFRIYGATALAAIRVGVAATILSGISTEVV
jgi:hypothetical protein